MKIFITILLIVVAAVEAYFAYILLVEQTKPYTVVVYDKNDTVAVSLKVSEVPQQTLINTSYRVEVKSLDDLLSDEQIIQKKD